MKRFIGKMIYKYYYDKYHNMIEESKMLAEKRKQASGLEKRKYGIEFEKLAKRKREMKKLVHKWEKYGNLKAYKYKNWYEENKVEVNAKRAFRRKVKAQEEYMKQKEIEQQEKRLKKLQRMREYYSMNRAKIGEYYKKYYREHKEDYKKDITKERMI